MPRKIKQKIEINNSESLSGLMQEAYNDACLQISDAQKHINELSLTVPPTDIDDVTKVAREKANLLKIKDSAVRVKLDLAKLQFDIIKNKGDVDSTIKDKTGGVSLKDFKNLRAFIKKEADGSLDDE